MVAARAATSSQMIVIDTTHTRTTADGGAWWQVGIPETSERPQVCEAHARGRDAQTRQRV
jgi:3D-(3,5/4)-trihydroxycyclohexane-1,2-dione acylhydrolase (decyclizing)